MFDALDELERRHPERFREATDRDPGRITAAVLRPRHGPDRGACLVSESLLGQSSLASQSTNDLGQGEIRRIESLGHATTVIARRRYVHVICCVKLVAYQLAPGVL